MVAERLKKHSVSLKYASKGVWYAFRTQPNLSVHFSAALVVVILGLIYRVSSLEWAVLLLTISSVLASEMLNTAIEIVTDALKEHKKTDQDDFYIMVAKDIGAGAVLISAVLSVIIGCVVFGPRLLGRS